MRRLRAATGLVVFAALAGVVPLHPDAAMARTRGAALPTGWEMCVLQGVGAPLTQANVSDLDTWQVAEGGSTNNDVAYNPFNTMRGTDQNDATLPAKYDAQGFPMFATWAAGCAATVATLLQANMAPIVTALVAGTVTPPTAFLATVDQTPWCAPSDGVPCYGDLIAGHSAVTTSNAIGLYHDTSGALVSYDRDVAQVAAIGQKLVAERQQVGVADLEVTLAQFTAWHAAANLRKIALYDYTSNPQLDRLSSALSRFQAPSQSDLLTQYYRGIDVTGEVAAYDKAKTSLVEAEAARSAAQSAVAETVSKLSTAQAATTRDIVTLDTDLVALQGAGVCTPPGAALATAPTPGTLAASAAGLSTTLGQQSFSTLKGPGAAPPTVTAPTPPTATAPPTTTTTPVPAPTTATTVPAAASAAAPADPASVATVRSCLNTLVT